MRNSFFTSVLCLSLSLICGEVTAFAYTRLTQISTEQGLNQSNVTSLLQDSDGYLWVGTYQGVNRYDGYRVTQLKSPNEILNNSSVSALFEDSLGLIWIGAEPENNYRLDKQKNQLNPLKLPTPATTQTSAEPDSESQAFQFFQEDEQRNLWIATNRSLYYYQRSQNQFKRVLSLAEIFANTATDVKSVSSAAKQHIIRSLLLVGGHLLIATSNGLFQYDLKTKVTRPLPHSPVVLTSDDQNNVKSLLQTQVGTILVGTVEGLFEIPLAALNQPTTVSAPNSRVLVAELNIWKIIETPDYFWLATDKGLFRLFPDGKLSFALKFSDSPYNTSDDNIVKLLQDREDNLWMGSRADGVFKWRPNDAIRQHLWTQSDARTRLSSDNVNSILQSSDGNIWIGTQNGLNRLDKNFTSVSNYLVEPDKKSVVSDGTVFVIRENLDKLWLSTYSGIRVFDKKRRALDKPVFLAKDASFFDRPAYDLLFFDPENLGILTESGLALYNLSSKKLTPVESGVSQHEIGGGLTQFFSVDTQTGKQIFIAGVDGLLKYSPQTARLSSFHQLPPADGPRTHPAAVYPDGNRLWVTYPGYGLFILDEKTGKEIRFFSEQFLNANTLMDIFDDSHNNLWITTNDGLLKINRQTFNSVFLGKDDGFATGEFNGAAIQRLKNGEVLLGGVKGVFRFDPDASAPRERSVKAKITGLSLLSHEIPVRFGDYNNQMLELKHDDFGLNIAFSALLFDKPDQVKYRYWSEGASKVESTLLARSELFIPTLKSGKTTLLVSAIDYETGQESAPASLTIISYPPLWFSNWAYITYFLLAVTLASLLMTFRKRRVKAKKIAHRQLRQSEERLSLALRGGNSGLWDWHASNNLVYEPRLCANQYQTEQLVSFKQRLTAIHPADQKKVASSWLSFLNLPGEAFEVSYRMRDESNQWVWYRDMATVSEVDQSGKPARVTGTFTNINESKIAADQMKLYSMALENTRDIVLLLDQDKTLIAANKAFFKLSGLKREQVLNREIDFILSEENDNQLMETIFKQIQLDQLWEGEGLLTRNRASAISVLINATSFIDDDMHCYYVFALTDIRKQKNAEAKLRKLANYDSLTGLPNRSLLLDRITHAIEHCQRKERQLALFFVDLDRFKQINDTLGHDVGDQVLKEVARLLTQRVRENDTVARLGGDEFVVVLEDIESLDAVTRVAKGIIQYLSRPLMLQKNQVGITPSIGISVYPNDGKKAKTLLKNADIAMYHAKNAGRNNFQYFESAMNKDARKQLSIENKLRNAVTNNEFYLVYQPQYELSTSRLIGVEALARWKSNNGKSIAPTAFIPAAEEIGVIISLSEKLLQQALADLEYWQQTYRPIGLAFNLSARHLHENNFRQSLNALLSQFDIDSHLLEFELTESVLMNDFEIAREIFDSLATQGIELALDDFGTGYSSLKYLNRLPIKKLKIDRSFVSQIGISNESDAIIQSIISLAKSLDMKTLAEGVETQVQLDFLRQSGCDQIQGFLFSKPLLPNELEKLLSKKLV